MDTGAYKNLKIMKNLIPKMSFNEYVTIILICITTHNTQYAIQLYNLIIKLFIKIKLKTK